MLDITQIIVVGIAAIISAIGGVVTGIMAARATSRKAHAEAGAIYAKGSAEAEAIRAQIEKEHHEAGIKGLRDIIEEQGRRYTILSEQYAEDLKDMCGRIDKLEGERKDFLESARQLQLELVSANDRISVLTRRVLELEGELQRKNAELARKNDEIERKNIELAHCQAQLSEVMAELEIERREGRGKL